MFHIYRETVNTYLQTFGNGFDNPVIRLMDCKVVYSLRGYSPSLQHLCNTLRHSLNRKLKYLLAVHGHIA